MPRRPGRAQGAGRIDRVLSVEAVSKRFGGVQALQDVALVCRPGEIVGLIGPNGAGKSSLVNVVTGLIAPDSGRVRLGSLELAGRGPEFVAHSGIARTFQNLRLFKQLSVRQNVEVALTSGRRHRPDKVAGLAVDALLAQQGLSALAEAPAGALAYGHQRRLEIARALALGPEVMLLDEPAAGMNDQETEALALTIREIRDERGIGIVVIDHDLGFIMGLCDRLTVMDMGRVVADGPPAAIRSDPVVIEIYLGTVH
jgi:branched-chain amino acid transport system ATP-binding protein